MEQSISKSNSRKFHLADKMGKLILLVFLLSTTYASAQVKKAFTPRYDETIKGDVTIIANNMLSAHKTNSFNATGDNQDSNNRVYVDIDSDPTTFNSSSATLNDPNPSLNCKEFVKAYLYWAASDKEAGGVSQNADSWNHNKVKLMLPGSSTYATITADEVLYRGRTEHFHNDPYICVKDITSDVVSLTNPYGKYQVGNVQATYGGLEPHGGGNYGVAGGWQIVFVYQSTDLLTRNITLFDGYAHVDNGATTDFNVDGFLSIPSGPVKADIILGSIEGDRVLNGDSFQIKKPDNTWQKISTPLRGQDNFFSSTISIDGAHFVNRNPASTNTLGYDASIFELSNPGNTLIANNQTSTTLRATSGQESYGLYLVGFSIEVYEPSLGALKFTTSPLNSTYNPGEIATLSMSIENSGNDNIRNLEISTILPIEVDFNSMDPLPDGVTYTFDTDTRELKFFVADGYIDTEDSFNIDFKVDVREQCYFLETACSANFSVQATATFTGEINTTPQTTNSSGTLDECGFGNFDPSIVAINQPAQVNWSSIANELDRTVSCDDAASLNAAQSLEPATEFCDFTLNKTDGAFVATPGCDAEGTYTNTWTFTDACGRVSDTFTQVITIEDNTDPNFNEALPADTVAAYDNIPSPAILTANDTCDTNPQVNLVETYNGDNSGTTYTIIRTWTASDCAGNTAEHTQNIYVTENGDPIGLAINDVSINENAGTATFNVALTGVTTSNFSVDFASANSSAIAPGDFIATTGTLPFNGQHGEIQNVVVTINDDAIIEDTESYTIELSSLTTSEIGINDASGLGTILDNDSATVSINDLDVNENAGVINVQVVLSGEVEESFTIDYATANGSALAGLDYNNVNDQLTFPANSTNGSFQNIAITINDDNLIEITENFLVNLSNITASGNVTIADNQANINITDNDAITGTGISFTDTNVFVTEGTDAFAIFTVTLTGNIAENVTVDYTTNEGTALNPSDFATTAGTLEFTPTVNSLDIQVPITDNAVIEPTEAFTVVLSNINSNIGIGFVDGNSTNTANGSILDDDTNAGDGISFEALDVEVTEGVGVTATFNVVLTGAVQDAFDVSFQTAFGTATATDFDAQNSILSFNGTDGEQQTITVTILNDEIIEPTEAFTVDLTGTTNALVAINTPQANGSILDDDTNAGDGISFEALDVEVTEGVGVTATFNVVLTGAVQDAFDVSFQTAFGTATATDFDAQNSILSFNGTDGEQQTITVTILNDEIIEPTEAFTVDLTGTTNALVAINTPQANGSILDDDTNAGDGISFEALDVEVTEGVGVTATFNVVLTGAVQDAFDVSFQTAFGTATATDFDAQNSILSFNGTDGEQQTITVTILNDEIIEPTEAFTVDLTGTTNALVAINTPQANGSILDDDTNAGDGISFEALDVEVTEGVGVTATFNVVLTGAVQDAFDVSFQTAFGTATATDFEAQNSILSFNGTDGEQQTITVTILNDEIIEPTEAFTVDLTGTTNALVAINTPQANGSILDDDTNAGDGISFEALDVEVTEGVGVTATFNVVLTGAVQDAFDVSFQTAFGTATATDFEAQNSILSFNGTDGEQQTITVTILNDEIIEPTEAFTVDLTGTTNALVAINTPQANGSILDDDTNAGDGISFEALDVEVTEGVGVTATFNVVLTGAVQDAFDVSFQTAFGTATATDFEAQNSILSFNGTDGEQQTITVTILNDEIIEPTEAFTVDLTGTTNALVAINTPQANGSILDDDTNAGDGISFEALDVEVTEGVGVTATFNVVLTGAVQDAFDVSFQTAFGTATATDFEAQNSILSFNGTDGEQQTITVTILNDEIIEPTEAFTVDLTGTTNALVAINTPQANGSILDDDTNAGDGISFEALDVEVTEGVGVTATFNVVLTGAVQDAFDVSFQTAFGTATATDFEAQNSILSFNGTDGEQQTITVTILNDEIIEPTEAFTVDLTGTTNALVAINTPQANGSILDDDTNAGDGISFEALDVEVTEGVGVTATFNVVLTGAVQDAFDVSFQTAFGTATATDFEAQNSILSFNGTDGEQQTITVTILNDEIIEPTEAFTVDLTGTTNALVAINTPQANGSILDDDTNAGDGISFEALDVEVTEGVGVTATFNVVLTGAVQDAFDVSFQTAFGTATATDFEAQNSILSFNGTDGEQQTITVTILNDEIIEPTEAFTVDLTGTTNALVAINTPQANGSILDDDTNAGDGISFEALDVEVTEGVGVTATFNVVLTGAVQDAFDVSFQTAFGTATATDFEAQNSILSFNGTDGEQQTITVTILNDEIIEPTEAFTVDLTGTTNALVAINTPQANGSILDDDTNAGDGISFEALDVEVTEGVGVTATFNVVLTGAVQDAFDVSFQTAFGTATATDFEAQNSILSFNGTDGEQQTITVTILNDEIIEPTEAFTVDLTGTTNALVAINTPQANGSILDDDTNAGDGISFEALDVEVTEGVGVTATFNVVLTGAVQDAFDVSFQTAFGTATATDFEAQNSILSFNGTDGEQQTITVTILNDEIIEPTEAFTVDLTGTTNALVAINTPQANGSILDDDTNAGDGISFEALDVEVTEGVGVTATFNVVLTGAVQDAFDVSFQTAFGTATATDFEAQNSILSFNGTDGEQQTITVTILNDEIIEPTEAFTVDLTGTTNALVAINTPQANGSILDDDTNAGDGISFEALDVEVTEGVGVTATFNVVLTGAVQDAFDVSFQTAFGTATATDFEAQNSILSFNGTDGEQQTITVTILNDEIIEPTEAFTVDLTGTTNALVAINTPQANGSILDDDTNAGDGISFEALDVEVTEGVGVTATFNVVLTGAVQDAFDVSFQTAFGTATATDFDAQNSILSFNGTDGEQQTITVTILNDEIIEPTEAFTVDLTGTTNALVAINTPQANGSILDDDAVAGTGISFTDTDIIVTEGTDAFAIFTVTLTGNISENVTVDYTTNEGTALNPSDFVTTAGTLEFTPTVNSLDIQVPITDNDVTEPTEAFTIVLSNIVSNIGIGFVDGNTTNTANGTIYDNDSDPSLGVQFNVTSVDVNEDAGTVTLDVVLNADVQDEFSVEFYTTNGTAISPDDYTAIPEDTQRLIFGGANSNTQTITIDIIDDIIIEDMENFQVVLTDIATLDMTDPLVNILANDTATVNIIDNDSDPSLGVQFNVASVDVNEDVGTVTLDVVLNVDVQDEFTVEYYTTDGTAISPDDYTAIPQDTQTLTFGGTNSNTQTITIDIIDDIIIEDMENFQVVLTDISTPLVNILANDTATVNIIDNDSDPSLGVQFNVTSVDVNEDAGTVTLDVVLNVDVQDEFTVEYYTTDGTAISPDDYTAIPQDTQTLTFGAANSNTQTITIDIIDDIIIEDMENFQVVLTDISTPLVNILANDTATVNIIDNDSDPLLGVQFNVTSVDVNEDAGTLTLDVVLNVDVQDEFTVEYYTTDGTAISPDDYTAIPEDTQTLTFGGANSNTQTITIDINDDIIIEDMENFQVVLTDISTPLVNILANDTATVNIIDNDGNEGYPEDMTIEACTTIPVAEDITSDSACAITAVLEEITEGQDDSCPTEYTITRTWTITDCIGNVRIHTQVITIEDTIAPTFIETLPQDMTVVCNEVPDAAVLTPIDNCDTNVEVIFEETATNDRNCSGGYVITRVWNAADCAGNAISHTQTITVMPNGPITSSAYDEEITIMCGDEIPEVPNLEFMGGCGDFNVVFNEETQFSEESDDYMIVRTWNVTDACDNMATFEQFIFVMQLEKETVTIDICVEDMTIDLFSYMPIDFDTNGVFTVTGGNTILNGSFFDPIDNEVGEHMLSYSSTEGTCKYYVDFVITVNTDCVPCGRKDIIASKTVTPNGDGVNDYFEITGVENCDFRFDVMLFNRWGSKVYEGVEYQNNWGGSSPNNSFGNSGMLPAGTYYYIIKVTNRDFEPINGYIYLGTK